MMRPPVGMGSVAGWAGTAFLIGMTAHALAPERPVPMIALTLIAVAALALMVTSGTWRRAFGICLLAFALGVWRYEVNRPHQPRGLIPLSPKGLAYVSADVRVSDRADPRYWLGRLRTDFTRRASERFAPDQAALLTGILYGERDFSKPLKEAFRRAGLLHIVAVSGSNVTIVTVLMMRILLWFRLPRRWAFAALSFFLVAFILFVAPAASVVRAAIMGWLVALAPVVGRIPRSSRLLLIAAAAFTAWKPWTLLYDAGFALSFLAMWGLLSYAPLFDARLASVIPWKGWRAILSATLGATLLTMPYAAWAFGQSSVIGLLTNLLVLPAIPFVMLLGAVALVLAPGSFLLLPAQGFLDWILLVAREAAALPIGVWSTRGMGIVSLFGWYAAIVGLWIAWRNGDKGYPQNFVNGDRVVRSV